MPCIRSSTDLRDSYNEVSTFCHENREPVFIAKNGQDDLAVMSIEMYEGACFLQKCVDNEYNGFKKFNEYIT